MFEPIDARKLIEQDEEFKKFVQEVIIDVFLYDKNARNMVGSIHSFYQIGMTPQQVAKWIKSMSQWGPEEHGEPARQA